MVSGLAGAPRPTGSGTRSISATPTQTATAVAAPPIARLARADRRIGAANRKGFSMKRSVSTASPPEMSTVASLPGSPSGWPSKGGASSSTGQCHRYQRVGDPADRAHWRHRQHASASLGGCGTAGADHQHRPHHRQQRSSSRIQGARAEQGAGQQDHAQARRAHDGGSSWRESAPLAGREGHQAARGQLPRPGGQRKERHGGRHERGGERQRERQGGDQGKDHQIRGCLDGGIGLGAPAYQPDEPRRADDQRRPHHVELFLDAQRPVVLERRGRLRRRRSSRRPRERNWLLLTYRAL